MIKKLLLSSPGSVAQLGERIVRNDEVVGSIPIRSTKKIKFVVVQSHLSGFAQNDLSNIDETSVWGLFLCLDPVFKCKLHFKIAL